jgi:hypothetical protein
MANTVNYAIQFKNDLMQKYTRELCTAGLTTQNVTFVGTNQIKIPYLTLAGYKDHSRSGGFNRQAATNNFLTKTLSFDRDVEFFVDSMDVDETNQVLAAANITNTFEEEHGIPETDAYRISKLYADFITAGGAADTTALTKDNILTVFDGYMEAMDEDGVPLDGRILYVTPAIQTLLKNAVTRQFQNGQDNIQRVIRALDNVTINPVPGGRMKTAFDFTDGFTPAVGAKDVNMLLVHPRSVIACDKHSYIRLWAPGSTTEGDGWLYQNRKYYDLFVIDTRIQGIKVNKDA